MQKIVLAMSQSSSPKLRQAADAAAKRRLEEAAEQLREDFEASEITKELDGGTGSANRSRTLRGGDASENLFSFIGFDEGDKPTEEIRKRLDPKHEEGPHVRFIGKDTTKSSVRFQYKAGINEDAIWRATPLPWAQEMSWAQKIEGKIQGFGSFIARWGAGHSGGGIQAKERGGAGPGLQILRKADYQRPEEGYLQTMFARFLTRLKIGRK